MQQPNIDLRELYMDATEKELIMSEEDSVETMDVTDEGSFVKMSIDQKGTNF